jgi:hypothetical protein
MNAKIYDGLSEERMEGKLRGFGRIKTVGEV